MQLVAPRRGATKSHERGLFTLSGVPPKVAHLRYGCVNTAFAAAAAARLCRADAAVSAPGCARYARANTGFRWSLRTRICDPRITWIRGIRFAHRRCANSRNFPDPPENCVRVAGNLSPQSPPPSSKRDEVSLKEEG